VESLSCNFSRGGGGRSDTTNFSVFPFMRGSLLYIPGRRRGIPYACFANGGRRGEGRTNPPLGEKKVPDRALIVGGTTRGGRSKEVGRPLPMILYTARGGREERPIILTVVGVPLIRL